MMHSAVKGFLGVWGALSLVVAGLVVFDDGADATTSEVDFPEAAPVVANVAETASAQPTQQVGSTMLEQAILDAFSSSPAASGSKRSASNAKDFVEASINAQGYLCADAVEMRQAAPGQYGIGCVMNRDGTGAAIYLVDSRSGSVTPIS